MPSPADIRDLVGRFEQQLETYKSGGYNETQLRRDFLDPLFRNLAPRRPGCTSARTGLTWSHASVVA